MTIKLPEEVTIGYTTFKIEDHRDKLNPHDDGAYGQNVKENQVIQIFQNNAPESEKLIQDMNTVIHEIMHGQFDVYGIPVNDKKEEQIVNMTANMFTEILVRNPDVLRFINEVLKKRKNGS